MKRSVTADEIRSKTTKEILVPQEKSFKGLIRRLAKKNTLTEKVISNFETGFKSSAAPISAEVYDPLDLEAFRVRAAKFEDHATAFHAELSFKRLPSINWILDAEIQRAERNRMRVLLHRLNTFQIAVPAIERGKAELILQIDGIKDFSDADDSHKRIRTLSQQQMTLILSYLEDVIKQSIWIQQKLHDWSSLLETALSKKHNVQSFDETEKFIEEQIATLSRYLYVSTQLVERYQEMKGHLHDAMLGTRIHELLFERNLRDAEHMLCLASVNTMNPAQFFRTIDEPLQRVTALL